MYNISGDIMFNTEITSKVYQLKEMLLKSNEYLDVKEKERIMEEKCSDLLIKYNYLFNEYNEALRFVKYGSDVNMAQKKLEECKKELDNNKYVIEYRASYKNMNKKLKEIERIIFEGITINRYIEI